MYVLHVTHNAEFHDCGRCRFHAYGVIMEMESYDALPLKDDSNRAHVSARKRTIGGK